jgi:hypothetical protein
MSFDSFKYAGKRAKASRTELANPRGGIVLKLPERAQAFGSQEGVSASCIRQRIQLALDVLMLGFNL